MRPDINYGSLRDISLPSLPELPSLSAPIAPVPDKLPMGIPLEERLLSIPARLEHVRFGNLNPNDPNDVPQIMEIVSKQIGQTPRILEQLRIGNPPLEAVRRGLAPSFGTPMATNLIANQVREELTFVKMLELSKKGQVTDTDLDDLGELIWGRKPSEEERKRLRLNLQDGIEELSEGAKLDMALRLERPELPMIYQFYRGLLSAYDGRELSSNERQALEQAKNELNQLRKEIRGTRKVPIDWLRQRTEKWSIIKNLLGLETGEPFVPALNTASLMNYLQRIENGLNSILNRSGTQANAAAQLLSILPGPFGNQMAGTIPLGIQNQEVGKVAYSYFRMLPFFQEVLKRPDDPLGRIFLVKLPDGRYRVPTLSEYYRTIIQNRHLFAQNMLKAIAPLREAVQHARTVFESLGSGSWMQSLLAGRNAHEIFNRIENLLDTLEREPTNERAFVELYRYLEPLLRGAEQKLGRASFVSRLLAPFGTALEIARNLYDRLASKLGLQPSGDIIGRGSTAPLMNLLGQNLSKELAEKINRYFGQATFYASLLHQVQPLYPNPADRIVALSGHPLGDPRGIGKFAKMALPPMIAWELARTVLSPDRAVRPLTEVGAAADTAMIGLTGEVNRLFKDWWRRLGLWYKEPLETPMGLYPVPELHQQAFGHSFPMMMAFSMNPTELAGQIVLAAGTMGIGPIVAGASRVGTLMGRLGTALARPLAGRFGLKLASRVAPVSERLARKLALGQIAHRMASLGRGAQIGSSFLLKELGLIGDWGDVDEIIHYTLQQEGMPQELSQRLLYLLSDPNVWMTSLGQGISFQPFTQPYHGIRTIIRGLRKHQPQLDLSPEYDVVLEPRWSLGQVQLYYTPGSDIDISQLQPMAELPEERQTGYVGIRNRTGQLIWYPIVGVSMPAENQIRVQVQNEQNELLELDPNDMNLLIVPKEPTANSGHYLPFLIGRSLATNNRGAPREYWSAQLGTLHTNALIESGFLQPTSTGEFQLDPELYQALRDQLMQPTLNTLDYALAYYDTIQDLMELDPNQIGQVEVIRERYENAIEGLRLLSQSNPRWLVLNRYHRLMEFLQNEEDQSAAMVLDALMDKILHDAPEIGLQVYEEGEYQPTYESVYALPIKSLNRLGVGGQALLKLMTLVPSLNLYRDAQGEFYLGLNGQDAQWLRQSGLLEQVRQQLTNAYRGFYEPDQGYPIYTLAGLLNDLRVLLGLDTRLRQVPVSEPVQEVSEAPAPAEVSEAQDVFQRWLVSQPVEELFQPDFEVVPAEEAREVLQPQRFEAEIKEVPSVAKVSRVDWKAIKEGIVRLLGFEPRDLFGWVHAFRSALSSVSVSFPRDLAHVARYSDSRAVIESLQHYLGHRVQRLVDRGAISEEVAGELRSFVQNVLDELYRTRVMPAHPVAVGATPVSFRIRSELQQRWRERVQRLDLQRDYRFVASLIEAVRLTLEDRVPATLQEAVQYFESFADRFQTYDDFVRYWDSDEVRSWRERYRAEWEQHGNQFVQELQARGIDSPSVYAFFELADPYNDLPGFMDFIHAILPSWLGDAVLLANQEGVDRAFRDRLYQAWMDGLRERLKAETELIEKVVAPIQWMHASYFAQEQYLRTVRDQDAYYRLLVDAVLGEQPVSVAGTELEGQSLGELIVRFAEPEIYAYTMPYEGREPYIFVSSQLVGRYPSLAVYTLYEELWHGLVYRLRAELERLEDQRVLSQALEVLLTDIGSRLLGRNMQVVLHELVQRVLNRYRVMGLDLDSLRELVSAPQEEQAVQEGLTEVLTELLERSERTGLTEPERLFILDAFRYWLVREQGLTTEEILGLPSYQLYGFFLEFIRSHTSERLGMGRGSFGLEHGALGSFPFRFGRAFSPRHRLTQWEKVQDLFASAFGAKVPITGRYQHGIIPVGYDVTRIHAAGPEIQKILSDYLSDFPKIDQLFEKVRSYVSQNIVNDDKFDVFSYGYWDVSHQGDKVILRHRLREYDDPVVFVFSRHPRPLRDEEVRDYSERLKTGVSDYGKRSSAFTQFDWVIDKETILEVRIPDKEAYRFGLLAGFSAREPLAVVEYPRYTLPDQILYPARKRLGRIDANNQLVYDVENIENRVLDWVRWLLPASLVGTNSYRLVQQFVHYPDRKLQVPRFVLEQEIADWVRYGITNNLGVSNLNLDTVVDMIINGTISFVRYQLYVPLPPEYNFDVQIANLLVVTHRNLSTNSVTTRFYLISPIFHNHVVLLEELTETIQNRRIRSQRAYLNQTMSVLNRFYEYLSLLGVRPIDTVYQAEPYQGDLVSRLVVLNGIPAVQLGADHFYLLSSSSSELNLPLGNYRQVQAFVRHIARTLNIDLENFTPREIEIDQTPLVNVPQNLSNLIVFNRSDLEGYTPIGMGVYYHASSQQHRIYLPEWERKWQLLAQLFMNYLQGRVWGINQIVPIILSDKWSIRVQGRQRKVLDYLRQLTRNQNLGNDFVNLKPVIFEGLDRIVEAYEVGRYESESDILMDRLRRLMTEDERLWRNPRLLQSLRQVPQLSDIAQLSDDDLSQLLDVILSDREFWRGYLSVVNQVNLVGRGWIDVKRTQVPVSVMFKEIYDRLYTIGEVQKNGQSLWNAEVYLGVQLGRVRTDETVLIYQETEEAVLNYQIVLIIPEADGERVIVRSLDEDEMRVLFFTGQIQINEGSDVYTVRSDLNLPGLLRYAILRMRLHAIRRPVGAEIIEVPQGVPLALPVHVQSGQPRVIEFGSVLNEYGWHRLFRWFRNVLNSYYERRKTHRLDEAKRRAYLQFLQSVAGYLIPFGLSDRPHLVSYLDRLGLYAHEPNYRVMHMMLGRVLGAGAYNPENRINQLGYLYRLLSYLAQAQNDEQIEAILDLLHGLEDFENYRLPLRPFDMGLDPFTREYSIPNTESGDPDRRFWVRRVYDILDVFEDEWLDQIWAQIPEDILREEGLNRSDLEKVKALDDLGLVYKVFRVVDDFIQSEYFDVITVLKNIGDDNALRRFYPFSYFTRLIARRGQSPDFWSWFLYYRANRAWKLVVEEIQSGNIQPLESFVRTYQPFKDRLAAKWLETILIGSFPASRKRKERGQWVPILTSPTGLNLSEAHELVQLIKLFQELNLNLSEPYELVRFIKMLKELNLNLSEPHELVRFIKMLKELKMDPEAEREMVAWFSTFLQRKAEKKYQEVIGALLRSLNDSEISSLSRYILEILSKNLSTQDIDARIKSISSILTNSYAFTLVRRYRRSLSKILENYIREVFSDPKFMRIKMLKKSKMHPEAKRKAVTLFGTFLQRKAKKEYQEVIGILLRSLNDSEISSISRYISEILSENLWPQDIDARIKSISSILTNSYAFNWAIRYRELLSDILENYIRKVFSDPKVMKIKMLKELKMDLEAEREIVALFGAFLQRKAKKKDQKAIGALLRSLNDIEIYFLSRYILEILSKNLSPQDIDERIKSILSILTNTDAFTLAIRKRQFSSNILEDYIRKVFSDPEVMKIKSVLAYNFSQYVPRKTRLLTESQFLSQLEQLQLMAKRLQTLFGTVPLTLQRFLYLGDQLKWENRKRVPLSARQNQALDTLVQFIENGFRFRLIPLLSEIHTALTTAYETYIKKHNQIDYTDFLIGLLDAWNQDNVQLIQDEFPRAWWQISRKEQYIDLNAIVSQISSQRSIYRQSIGNNIRNMELHKTVLKEILEALNKFNSNNSGNFTPHNAAYWLSQVILGGLYADGVLDGIFAILLDSDHFRVPGSNATETERYMMEWRAQLIGIGLYPHLLGRIDPIKLWSTESGWSVEEGILALVHGTWTQLPDETYRRLRQFVLRPSEPTDMISIHPLERTSFLKAAEEGVTAAGQIAPSKLDELLRTPRFETVWNTLNHLIRTISDKINQQQDVSFNSIVSELILATEFIDLLREAGVLRLSNHDIKLITNVKSVLSQLREQIANASQQGTISLSDYQQWTSTLIQITNDLERITRWPTIQPPAPLQFQFTTSFDAVRKIHDFYLGFIYPRLLNIVHPLVEPSMRLLSTRFEPTIPDETVQNQRREAIQAALMPHISDFAQHAEQSFELLVLLLRTRRYNYPEWEQIDNMSFADLQKLKQNLKEIYQKYSSEALKLGKTFVPSVEDSHFDYVAALLGIFLLNTNNNRFIFTLNPSVAKKQNSLYELLGIPLEPIKLDSEGNVEKENFIDDRNVIQQILQKRRSFHSRFSIPEPYTKELIPQIIDWFAIGTPDHYRQILSVIDQLASMGYHRDVSLILSALQGAAQILNRTPSSINQLLINYHAAKVHLPSISLPIWSQLIVDLSHFIREKGLFSQFLTLASYPYHLNPYRDPMFYLTPQQTQREATLQLTIQPLYKKAKIFARTIKKLIKRNASINNIKAAIKQYIKEFLANEPTIYEPNIRDDIAEYVYSLYVHPYLNELVRSPDRLFGTGLTILYHLTQGEIRHIAKIQKAIQSLIGIQADDREQLLQILMRYSLPLIVPDVPIIFNVFITPSQLPQYEAFRADYIHTKQNLLTAIYQLTQKLQDYYQRDLIIQSTLQAKNYQASWVANQVGFALALMIGSRISQAELNPSPQILQTLIQEMKNFTQILQNVDMQRFSNINFDVSPQYIQELIRTIIGTNEPLKPIDQDIIQLTFDLIDKIRSNIETQIVNLGTQPVHRLSRKLARFRPWIRPEMFNLLYRLAITSNQARDTLEEQFSAEQAIYSWIRHLMQLVLPSSQMLPQIPAIPQTLVPAQPTSIPTIKPLHIMLALREKQKLDALRRGQTETIPYYLAPLPNKPTEEIRNILELITILEPIYNSFGRIPQPSSYVFYANESIITLMLLLNMAGYVPVITRYHTVGSIIFNPDRAKKNIERLEEFILNQFIPSYALDVPVPQPTQELENAIKTQFRRLRQLQNAFIQAFTQAAFTNPTRGVENFIRTVATLQNPEQVVMALLSDEGTQLLQQFEQLPKGQEIVNEVIHLAQMIMSGAMARRASQFGTLAHLLSATPEPPQTNQPFIFPTIRTTLIYQKTPVTYDGKTIDENYDIIITTYRDQNKTSRIKIRLRRNDIMLLHQFKPKTLKELKSLLKGEMITDQEALDYYMSEEFRNLLYILEHAVPDEQKKLIIDFRQYLSIAKERGIKSKEAEAYRNKFLSNKDYLQIFHMLKNTRTLKQKIAIALVKNPNLSTSLSSIQKEKPEFDPEAVPITIEIELISRDQSGKIMKQTQTQTYNSIGRIPLSIRRFAGTLNIDETIRDIIQYIRNGNDFDQYGRVFFIQPTPEQEVSEPSIQAQRSLEETIQYGEEGEDETTIGETIPGTLRIASEKETSKTEKTSTKKEKRTPRIVIPRPTSAPKIRVSIKATQLPTSQTMQPQQQTILDNATIYQTILTDALRFIINIAIPLADDKLEPVLFRLFPDIKALSKGQVEISFEEMFERLFVVREKYKNNILNFEEIQKVSFLEKKFFNAILSHPYIAKLKEQNIRSSEILEKVIEAGRSKSVRITIHRSFTPGHIILEADVELFTPEHTPASPTTGSTETGSTPQPSPSGGTGGQATTQGQTRQFRTIKTPPSQHPYRRIGGTPDFFTP